LFRGATGGDVVSILVASRAKLAGISLASGLATALLAGRLIDFPFAAGKRFNDRFRHRSE
jgi:hypothetical protein